MTGVTRQSGVRGAAFAAAAMLLARASFAAGLALSVHPRSVELGEAVSLTLSLSGASPRAQPRLRLPAGVRIAGGPSQTSRTLITNGRMTSSMEFRYTLAFDRAGSYTLGPATIRTTRGVLRSPAATVTVRAAGKSRDVLVFAELEPARAYVGQPVVATFAFAVARKIGGYNLTIPFLAEITGVRLHDPENLSERWTESAQKTGRGLPGYTVLRVSRPALQAVAKTGSRVIDGQSYTVFTVRRVLLPQEPGRRELGAASASANVIMGYRRRGSLLDDPFGDPFGGSIFGRGRSVTRTVTAASEPLVLEVLPLPEEGRPAGFEGAVGRYDLSASASPREVKLGGDPIELTLTVRGEGNVETVGRPALADGSDFRIGAAEMHQDIRFEDGKLVGEKRFVLPLRPRSANVTQVPEARLVVFDPTTEKYVTLRTDPIPVRISVPEGTGARGSVAIPAEARKRLRGAGEVKRDIEDIETEVDGRGSHAAWLHRPAGLLLFLVLPLGVYAVLAVVAGRLRRLREDETLALRLAAARTARSRLDELRAGGALTPGDFAARLARVFQTYLADRLGRPAGELAPDEAGRLLGESGAPAECAVDAATILRDAEAARFGGGGVDTDEWLRRVEGCIESIEKGAKA